MQKLVNRHHRRKQRSTVHSEDEADASSAHVKRPSSASGTLGENSNPRHGKQSANHDSSSNYSLSDANSLDEADASRKKKKNVSQKKQAVPVAVASTSRDVPASSKTQRQGNKSTVQQTQTTPNAAANSDLATPSSNKGVATIVASRPSKTSEMHSNAKNNVSGPAHPPPPDYAQRGTHWGHDDRFEQDAAGKQHAANDVGRGGHRGRGRGGRGGSANARVQEKPLTEEPKWQHDQFQEANNVGGDAVQSQQHQSNQNGFRGGRGRGQWGARSRGRGGFVQSGNRSMQPGSNDIPQAPAETVFSPGGAASSVNAQDASNSRHTPNVRDEGDFRRGQNQNRFRGAGNRGGRGGSFGHGLGSQDRNADDSSNAVHEGGYSQRGRGGHFSPRNDRGGFQGHQQQEFRGGHRGRFPQRGRGGVPFDAAGFKHSDASPMAKDGDAQTVNVRRDSETPTVPSVDLSVDVKAADNYSTAAVRGRSAGQRSNRNRVGQSSAQDEPKPELAVATGSGANVCQVDPSNNDQATVDMARHLSVDAQPYYPTDAAGASEAYAHHSADSSHCSGSYVGRDRSGSHPSMTYAAGLGPGGFLHPSAPTALPVTYDPATGAPMVPVYLPTPDGGRGLFYAPLAIPGGASFPQGVPGLIPAQHMMMPMQAQSMNYGVPQQQASVQPQQQPRQDQSYYYQPSSGGYAPES